MGTQLHVHFEYCSEVSGTQKLPFHQSLEQFCTISVSSIGEHTRTVHKDLQLKKPKATPLCWNKSKVKTK